MTERWGALPLNEDFVFDRQRCVNCGEWCAENYEHCDTCLVRAVRGIFEVDRAVHQHRTRSSRYRRLAP